MALLKKRLLLFSNSAVNVEHNVLPLGGLVLQAEKVIDGLDGQIIEGSKQLCVTFPRPPKRTRNADEDETTLVE
eukprot:5132960-Amphidinium_carterae.2